MMKDLNHLFGRISIRNKLLILTTGLAIVPLVFFFLITVYLGFSKMEVLSTNSLKHEARTIGNQTRAFLGNLETDLKYLSRSPLLMDFIANRHLPGEPLFRARAERQLVLLAQMHPFYHQLRFIDVNGLEAIRVESKGGRITVVPPGSVQQKGHRYYFQEAMAIEQGDIYVSPMDYNVEHGQIEVPKLPVFRYATPVHVGGERKGVFVINIFGRSILDVLKGIPARSYESLSLLDDEGRIIASGTQSEGKFDLFIDMEESVDERTLALIRAPTPTFAPKDAKLPPSVMWSISPWQYSRL